MSMQNEGDCGEIPRLPTDSDSVIPSFASQRSRSGCSGLDRILIRGRL